jgi:hypothetical protein
MPAIVEPRGSTLNRVTALGFLVAACLFALGCSGNGTQTAPSSTSRSAADVFAYCSSVATVDDPSPHDLYKESVKTALTAVLGHPPSGVDVPWRCMDGNVWACDFGANLPCGAAGTSREPSSEMRQYCATAPDGGIPFYVTGHGLLYSWECQGGTPIAGAQQYETDSRGFITQYWYLLSQSGSRPTTQTDIRAGIWAEVYGTGSCLNVRESPSASGATKHCIKDGTVVQIKDGPVAADGYLWWSLSSPETIYDSWSADT